MKKLLIYLETIHPLSTECISYLNSVIKFRVVRKNEILLRIGETNRFLYFVNKGALHCFYYVRDRAVSDWFFWEGETVVSIGSFYDQLPSEDCIIALEDCELFYISKEEYDILNKRFLEFNYIARVLLEKYLKVFHGHARFIRKTAASDRYQLVMTKMPELIQRIPIGSLASWLNMEPETLSRMRSRRE